MDTRMLIELIGYAGSVLVILSMLMSSVVKLRIVNSVGSFIFAIYALIIQSYPTAVVNLCLVVINIYNLHRLLRKGNCYQLIKSRMQDSCLQHLLQYYRKDIKEFFPEFAAEACDAELAYVVTCDASPAGVFLGKWREDGNVQMILDYSTPRYRDCSVGRFLYEQLGGQGIPGLIYSGGSKKHEDYLQKMGFVRSVEGFRSDAKKPERSGMTEE